MSISSPKGCLADNTNVAGAGPVAGEDNMYVWRQSEGARFIATLSVMDGEEPIPDLDLQNPISEFGDWQPGLGQRTAEVSPNGSRLVFESNNQAVGGSPPEVEGNKLEEVYVYGYGEDRLSCASCDPAHGSSPPVPLSEIGLGAFLPQSWRAVYRPDRMTDNGNRVVFDGIEPRVPEDESGKPDVYVWKGDGTGSCALGSGVSGGCVSLSSGGASDRIRGLLGRANLVMMCLSLRVRSLCLRIRMMCLICMMCGSVGSCRSRRGRVRGRVVRVCLCRRRCLRRRRV